MVINGLKNYWDFTVISRIFNADCSAK